MLRLSNIPGRIDRKCRMSIHAILFQGHEIGTDISLFEYPDANAAHRRDNVCRTMVRPAVAIQDQIGDPPVASKPAEKLRPFYQGAGIIGCIFPPVVTVTAIQVNAMNRVAFGAKALGEPSKEIAMRALQESEYLSFDHYQISTPAPAVFPLAPRYYGFQPESA
jgi:hypothetical protein